jgi:DNA-binding NarL/FixJ family response regulator
VPLNLVLIEDHAEFREQLRSRLQAIDGVHVIHAESTAAAAIEWLGGHPQEWNLLVVDLFLAKGHGFQVLSAAKNRTPGQKTLLLTSYTRDPVREQARHFGADAVFDKLFELADFLSYIERCSSEAAQAVGAPEPQPAA